ncbi:hypothetical protein HBI27_015080 [Parastagonospora nodorum]|nr:hypothetical protein HBI27_015080 [Parastagonospora nodorum]
MAIFSAPPRRDGARIGGRSTVVRYLRMCSASKSTRCHERNTGNASCDTWDILWD